MIFINFFDSLSVVKLKNVDDDEMMKKLQKTWDCAGGRFHDFYKNIFIEIYKKNVVGKFRRGQKVGVWGLDRIFGPCTISKT